MFPNHSKKVKLVFHSENESENKSENKNMPKGSRTDLDLDLDYQAFIKLPKVKMFLDSIGRNSLKSRKSYSTSLRHLHNFVISNSKYTGRGLDSQTILEPLLNNEINVYELLDSFVSYIIQERKGITPKSINLYMTAIRSYFGYYDIDVIPSKFKRKVKMPRVTREDEESIEVKEIRDMLLACNNRRLKTIILTVATGAMRITECLAIRNKDIDFSLNPTKVHLRKEYTKTKVARDIYISDEATDYLKQWLDWKYKNPNNEREFHNDDLVFAVFENSTNPHTIYGKVWEEFDKLRKIVKMDKKKDSGNRNKITLHTFRRFCKTVVSDQTSEEYSEWFIGHDKSPYWTKKEPAKREIYKTKVMKYLTFLDYSTLETTGKNIEAKLNEKENEIQSLRQRDLRHETELEQIRTNQLRMQSEFAKLGKTLEWYGDSHDQFMKAAEPDYKGLTTEERKAHIRKIFPNLFQ